MPRALPTQLNQRSGTSCPLESWRRRQPPLLEWRCGWTSAPVEVFPVSSWLTAGPGVKPFFSIATNAAQLSWWRWFRTWVGATVSELCEHGLRKREGASTCARVFPWWSPVPLVPRHRRQSAPPLSWYREGFSSCQSHHPILLLPLERGGQQRFWRSWGSHRCVCGGMPSDIKSSARSHRVLGVSPAVSGSPSSVLSTGVRADVLELGPSPRRVEDRSAPFSAGVTMFHVKHRAPTDPVIGEPVTTPVTVTFHVKHLKERGHKA